MLPDHRVEPQLSASQRLAVALGRPPAEPLSSDELVALDAAQDRADADAERVWGVRGQAAA